MIPVGIAAYEVRALLPIIPLIARSLTTTPAATTVAADAEAINNGLDARLIRLGDAVAGAVAALLPDAAGLPLAVWVLAVVPDLGVLAAVDLAGEPDELWVAELFPADPVDDPPPDEPELEPPEEVGADVGVTPGTYKAYTLPLSSVVNTSPFTTVGASQCCVRLTPTELLLNNCAPVVALSARMFEPEKYRTPFATNGDDITPMFF